MPTLTKHQNGAVQCCVEVRPEPPGQFTALALGLPDVSETAATRQEALERIQETLSRLLASGQLVSIEVRPENPLLQWAGHTDPNDPDEQAYLDALAHERREDLESTLRELDQECSNSSSTPTT